MYKVRCEVTGRVVFSGDYWDCKEFCRVQLEDDEDFFIEDPKGYAIA